MASNTDTPAKQPAKHSGAKPMSVYVVTERENNGETYKRWREVGVAWKHADGESFTVQIEPGISISGDNIVVRPRKEKEGESAE